MICSADTTLSKLASGSPMPIITTLEMTRSFFGVTPMALLAHHSWPMISAVLRLRLKPWRPVEQKVHSSAQPTWDDMHKVPRSSSGMNTVSTPLPVPTSSSHLRVPSSDSCDTIRSGTPTCAVSCNLARRLLAMSVMASKSASPIWCIQRMICLARNGFSPMAAKCSVSWGRLKSSRLVFMSISGKGGRPQRAAAGYNGSSVRPGLAASALAGYDFGSSEEVSYFDRGVFQAVGTVNGVGVDGIGEVSTDGAGVGFLRIGRAHQFAVFQDGVFAFQYLDHDRAGDDEVHQIVEE